MGATFTPGPWVANNHMFIKAPNGFTVALVRGPSGRGKEYYEGLPYCQANARLIAAAPELLEALDAVELARMTDEPKHWDAATTLTAKAIAKARGQ